MQKTENELLKHEVNDGLLFLWFEPSVLEQLVDLQIDFSLLKLLQPDNVSFCDNTTEDNSRSGIPSIQMWHPEGSLLHVGEEIVFYIQGMNNGSNSTEDSYLTISFPGFNDVISYGGTTWHNDLTINKYPKNSTIWRCDGDNISANYVLIDGFKEGWNTNQIRSIWGKVKPTSTGLLTVYGKMNIGNNRTPTGGCGGPDQQRWPVMSYSVNITESGCNSDSQWPSYPLTPTSNWQYLNNIYAGEYAVFSVNNGTQYQWSLCALHCGNAPYDSELTLRKDSDNSFIAYADNICNNDARITWTANFTGNVRVVVTRYNCQSQNTSTRLAYKSGSLQVPSLSVSPSNRNVGSSSGQTTFTITSNTEWSLSNLPSWITSVNPSSGNGNSTVTVKYDANTGSQKRTATINGNKICGSGISFTVTQEAPSVPSITVTYPNGGENWQAGTTKNITWTSSNVSGNIKIELFKGGSFNSQIANSVSNNGSYSWNIPPGQAPGSDYKVKISSVNDSSINDFSNNNFTISGPSFITVTSPNGGENWQRGTTENITWTSSNVSGNVKIELFKGGSFNSTIANSVSNSGSYSWNIPAGLTAGTDYKVKISSVGTPSIHDFSNNNFTISAQPFISIISPVGGEAIDAGSVFNINWEDNINENVRIELWKGNNKLSNIADSEPSNGEYIWHVPGNLTAGNDYWVKIVSVNTSSVFSMGNNFTINNYLMSGIYVKVIETAGTNMVKKIGYDYSYIMISHGMIEDTKMVELDNNGTAFLCYPDLPYGIHDINDFHDKILLFDANENQIGHIPFSFSYQFEGMHTRQVILLFHNDTQICLNPDGGIYFPYHPNSPNNLNGQPYSYYQYGEYPVSMLIPPHHKAHGNQPEGYRLPSTYNTQPLLFVHGLTGTFSYQKRFGAEPKNTNTKGDQVSYWFNTERYVNSFIDAGEQEFHAWQFYYPAQDDLRHGGFMLERAVDYLHITYSQNSKKIGIIAHSMGGLVTMDYLTRMDISYTNQKIFRVLLVMSPFRGSLIANRVYGKKAAQLAVDVRNAFMEYFNIDNTLTNDLFAPCYRDLSIGSDFINNLHSRNWSNAIDLSKIFTIIGLTRNDYKLPNQFHSEAHKHHDGIVSFSSASLLDKGIGFMGFYGNHDDGKFGATTFELYMPWIISSYFQKSAYAYENFRTFCVNSSFVDVFVEVSGQNAIVKKPSTSGMSLNNLTINKPDVDFQKGMITLKEITPTNSSVFYLYEKFPAAGYKYVISPYEISSIPGVEYHFERGRFIRNDKASTPHYFFVTSMYTKQDCAFDLWQDWDENTHLIYVRAHDGELLNPFTLNKKVMQHQIVPVQTSNINQSIANESTPTKGLIPGVRNDELLTDIFVDDQASTIDFHLYSDRAFFNSIPYHLTLLSPDGLLIDSTSTNVSYQSNPLTSVKTLTVNSPIPGKWQVLPVTDPLWIDSLQYISKGVLASEIKSKSLIEQSGHDIESPIELSGKIIVPDATLLNNDSLNAYMLLKRSLHVYDTLYYNGINISDTTVVFNFEFVCDSIGIYLYEMVFNGVYNNYRFERAVYGDFRADDLSPHLFIPNQHLNPVYSWAELSLPQHLYCQTCNLDSLIFDITLLSSTLDTNMHYSYNDSTQRFRVSVGNEFPGEAIFKAKYFMNDSVNLTDTFHVIYSIPCKYPAYLDVSHVTTNSAKLIWTPAGDENEWDLIWGLAGFDLHTQGTLAEGLNDTLLNIAGLETGTAYSYYVRAICSENDNSFWEGPRVFSTHQSCPGIPTVEYEGKTYNTILIGEQCWISENLDVGTMIPLSQHPSDNGIIEKYCYDDNPANCEIYGGLYSFAEATNYTYDSGVQGICPPGWHIPTHEEWIMLEGTVDSKYDANDTIWENWINYDPFVFLDRGFDAGKKLKSADSWNGHDEFGFNALPGGTAYSLYNVERYYSGLNSMTSFYNREFHTDFDGVYIETILSGTHIIANYVRCIKTDYTPPTSCAAPSDLNLIENIPNGAKIGWIPQGNEHAWDIAYGLSGFDVETEGTFISGVNSNPVTIFNLEYETEYDVYVRASCWDDSLSDWAGPFTFYSSCPEYNVPLSENFDAVVPPALPGCWNKIENGTSATVQTTSEQAFNGDNSLKLYFWGDDESVLLASPVLQQSVSDLRLKFKSIVSYGGFMGPHVHYIEIGTMSNSNDISSFESYETVWLTPGIWDQYYVNFDSYIGSNSIIGIKYSPSDFANRGLIYIDDVVIEPIPGCMEPHPLSLTSSNYTTNSALLSWLSQGDETAWDIQWGSVGFNLGQGNLIHSATSNPFLLQGLNQSTTYDYYVRANCGESNVSNWKGPHTFTTAFIPPHFQDFDASLLLPAGWGGDFEVMEGIGFEGNALQKHFYGSVLDAGVWVGQGEILSPSFNVIPDQDYKFGFSYLMWSYDHMPFSLPDGTYMLIQASFDHGESFSTLHTINNQNHSPTTSFTEVEIEFTPVSEYLIIRIYYFAGVTYWFNTHHYLWIDDFFIHSLCDSPTNLASSNPGNYSVEVAWTAGSTENSWDIIYGTTGFNPQTQGTLLAGITANPFTLTGLQPNTNYDVYVRAVCSGGVYSEWTGPASFSTLQPYQVSVYANPSNGGFVAGGGFYEHGENAMVTATENYGWEFLNWTENSYVVSTNHNYSFNVIARRSLVANFEYTLEPDCLTPVNPVINIVCSDDIPVSGCDYFFTWDQGGDELIWDVKFGFNGFDVNNEGTLIPGLEETIYHYENPIPGTGYDFYVRAICSDDVSDWVGPESLITICFIPRDLSIIDAINNSVLVGWTTSPGINQWEIVYGPPDFNPLTGGSLITDVTTNPFLIEGLNPGSEYDFYVRAICANSFSGWSFPASTTPLPIDQQLSVNPTALNFENVMINSCATLSYQISGTDLTNHVTITAPPGFQVSTQETTAFEDAITVSHSNGSVDQTIYVQFCPDEEGDNSGEIINASAGAVTQVVAVEGYGMSCTAACVSYYSACEAHPPVYLDWFCSPSEWHDDPIFIHKMPADPKTGSGNYVYSFSGPSVYEQNGSYYFDPAIGLGTYVIQYTVTDTETGCTAYAEFPMTVAPYPDVSCPDDLIVSIDDTPFYVSGVMPEGGEFNGPISMEGLFNPSAAGIGTHIITYTYPQIYETTLPVPPPPPICQSSCIFHITVTPAAEPGVPTIIPENLEATLMANTAATQILTVSNLAGDHDICWSASVVDNSNRKQPDDLPGLVFSEPVYMKNENPAVDATDTFVIVENETPRATWNILQSFSLNSGGQTGIATDGNYIYSSYWNQSGKFGKYTLEGEWIEDFTIAGVGGIRDLSFDGTYFYGGAATALIYQLDLANQELVGTITSPIIVRHISYDPNSDAFWLGSWTTLRLVSRSGSTITTGPSLNNAFGSAYDNLSPGGPYLWFFTQNATAGCGTMYDWVQIQQFRISDLSFTGLYHCTTDLPGYSHGEFGSITYAGGAFASDLLIPGKFVLMVSIQQTPGLVGVYDLTPSDSWLVLDNYEGTIAPGETQDIQVTFNATALESGTYEALIRFEPQQNDDNTSWQIDVPATMHVEPMECHAPTDLYSSNITQTTAVLGWTAANSEHHCEVQWGMAGFNPASSGIRISNIHTESVSIESLAPLTDYEFYVRTVCATGFASNWAGPHQFTTNPRDCNPPENLQATLHEHDVLLSWGSPLDRSAGYQCLNEPFSKVEILDINQGKTVIPTIEIKTTPEQGLKNTFNPIREESIMLHYDGDNSSSVGLGNTGGTLYAAARFPAEMVSQYNGYSLTSVMVYITSAPPFTMVKIWSEGSAESPGSLVYEQWFPAKNGSWNTIELTNPVELDGGDIWIGYMLLINPGQHSAGTDNGPAHPFGDFYSVNGDDWDHLVNANINRNFNIRGVVAPTVCNLIGYNIYRNGVLITTTDAETNEYSDLSLAPGTYSYEVTALYGEPNPVESAPTDAVTVYIGYDGEIPQFIQLTSTAIASGEEVCFDALQTITVSDFTVEPGGSATLIAGESIHLLPGTTVEHGGYLLARIAQHANDYCGIPRATEIAKEPVTSKEEDVVSADFPYGVRENGFFKLYPNPTDGSFTLELTTVELEQGITVEINSMLGGQLFTKELPPQRLHTLSLEGQQPGMYIIRVMKGDKVGVERLIKR